jgi:hypothetical protein
MSTTMLAWVFGGALAAVILLSRFLGRRYSDGYTRRFVNGAPRRMVNGASGHDTAFPFASTLYVGDGGGSSHAHHGSADCAHSSDAGGGCAVDGGGGGSH